VKLEFAHNNLLRFSNISAGWLNIDFSILRIVVSTFDYLFIMTRQYATDKGWHCRDNHKRSGPSQAAIPRLIDNKTQKEADKTLEIRGYTCSLTVCMDVFSLSPNHIPVRPDTTQFFSKIRCNAQPPLTWIGQIEILGPLNQQKGETWK
jgi:hypothetical protein